MAKKYISDFPPNCNSIYRFHFESKNDVWISQARFVDSSHIEIQGVA